MKKPIFDELEPKAPVLFHGKAVAFREDDLLVVGVEEAMIHPVHEFSNRKVLNLSTEILDGLKFKSSPPGSSIVLSRR